MNARAALFDLYGDHLRQRGGEASISAIIRLLDPLDIAPAAVRTAVSRMVRQGWLTPTRTGEGPGYRITERARQRLDEAGRRIYALDQVEWDGRWSLLVVERSHDRARRERLHRGLEYLGYRVLHGSTWAAPQGSVEAEALIRGEGLACDEFRAELRGDSVELVNRLYRLSELATAYSRWLVDAHEIIATAGESPDDREAFAVRSQLVHEWRKFLFRDPGLPPAVLPPDWPGREARRYFDAQAERLLPGAKAFVDCCLKGKAT